MRPCGLLTEFSDLPQTGRSVKGLQSRLWLLIGRSGGIFMEFYAKIFPNNRLLPQTEELAPVWDILDPSEGIADKTMAMVFLTQLLPLFGRLFFNFMSFIWTE